MQTGTDVAAWVQAIGSIIAILVAIAIPAWQRWASLRDARTDQCQQAKERAKRMVAALKAEVIAAIAALERQLFATKQTLLKIRAGRQAGAQILNHGPISPGSMIFTDGVIYRQVAAELGRLPADLVSSMVQFYAMALEMTRLAESSSSAETAYEIMQDLIPRALMCGELLRLSMDKFERSDFEFRVDLRPTPDEMSKLAKKVGYPLQELMQERGISWPQPEPEEAAH